jgi:DNA recombination protein RmuC
VGSSALIFAVVAVAVFLVLVIWFSFRAGAAQALANERKLSEVREAGLREQLEAARVEVTALRLKSEELAASKEREKAQEEKYLQMKADVDKAFADLASKALRDNNASFLHLAEQKLGAQSSEAKQTLEAKEAAIKTLLDPLEKALNSLGEQTRAMEITRTGAYSEMKTLVENIQGTIPVSLTALRNETAQLITALRAPKTRGNWGELQLKRCVEYAGMVQYCSFSEQVTARDEDERLLRPDMTVQLPNGRMIVVDAKTPLDAFLDSNQGVDPSLQALRFVAHAERVKSHLRDLSSKAYWRQFDQTPEFVVCFLPSEALFSAALEADPSLIEFGSQANVLMATPTTLIALLKAVAYGWQQSQVAQNAKKIQETGQVLYNKLLNAHEHFSKLGSALENAVSNYNRFVGAVEGRGGAFFHARKLGNLVHGVDEIEVLEALPAEPRELTAEDWESTPRLAFSVEADDSAKTEI